MAQAFQDMQHAVQHVAARRSAAVQAVLAAARQQRQQRQQARARVQRLVEDVQELEAQPYTLAVSAGAAPTRPVSSYPSVGGVRRTPAARPSVAMAAAPPTAASSPFVPAVGKRLDLSGMPSVAQEAAAPSAAAPVFHGAPYGGGGVQDHSLHSKHVGRHHVVLRAGAGAGAGTGAGAAAAAAASPGGPGPAAVDDTPQPGADIARLMREAKQLVVSLDLSNFRGRAN